MPAETARIEPLRLAPRTTYAFALEMTVGRLRRSKPAHRRYQSASQFAAAEPSRPASAIQLAAPPVLSVALHRRRQPAGSCDEGSDIWLDGVDDAVVGTVPTPIRARSAAPFSAPIRGRAFPSPSRPVHEAHPPSPKPPRDPDPAAGDIPTPPLSSRTSPSSVRSAASRPPTRARSTSRCPSSACCRCCCGRAPPVGTRRAATAVARRDR